MKNLLIIFYFISFPFVGSGQSLNQNYISTYNYREASVSSDVTKAKAIVIYYDGLGRPVQEVSGKMSNSGKDMIIPIEYDAFGRQSKDYMPYEVTTTDQSYDNAALSNVLTFYNKTAYENTANPYSERFFDNSPLNRVTKSGAPGTHWKGNEHDNEDHTIKYGYLTNVANEVKLLKATASWNAGNKVYEISINDNGYYSAGKLYKNIIGDENRTGNLATTVGFAAGQREEFKDITGKIILKRTYFESSDNLGMPTQGYSDTHYVYDQYDNLTYVIPFTIYSGVSQNDIDQLGYQYKYDKKNRLVEKKLPGKAWEFIVYDQQDRPVATGPVYSPFGSTGNTDRGWIITKYDVFGRPAYSGWYSASNFTSSGRNEMQSNSFATVTKTNANVLIDNIAVFYTNVGFPTNSLKLLTVNYYDNYTFPSASPFPSGRTGVEGQPAIFVSGLLTGVWNRIITTSNQTFGEVKTMFYDNMLRIIRERTTNSQLGGYTQVDQKFRFDGLLEYKITTQKRTNSSSEQELRIRNDYSYTAQDRLLSEIHKVNEQNPELILYNTYNSIGQLISKRVGRSQSSPLQVVDFAYNIRGWLKSINDVSSLSGSSSGTPTDLFAMKINYTDPTVHVQVPTNFNGNITELTWKTSYDNIARKYSFRYDKLNRLLDSYYQMPQAQNPVRNSFDEQLRYDARGNIRSLKRNGGLDDYSSVIQIDNLTYTYSGNRLMKIVDSTNSPQGFKDATATNVNDFEYDDFGNLIADFNKGIQSNSIIYNHLNLPVRIFVNNGANSGTISFVYNGSGVKLTKTVTKTGTNSPSSIVTDYLNGFQYTSNVLDFFPTSEGYVKNTPSAGSIVYSYVYQYRDHLGNIRLSYTLDPLDSKVKIMEENHYYPFGLKHEGYSSDQQIIVSPGDIRVPSIILTPALNPTDVTYKYKYNDKELQDELGLNMYDYGARNYDPALGRWMNIDPNADNYVPISPYVYAINNPNLFVDPDGKDVYIYYIGPRRRWYNYPFYTFDGHNALGARPYGYSNTTYANLSGSAERTNAPDSYRNEYGYSRYIDESKTIMDYVRSGETVIRMRVKLDKEAEEVIASYIATEAANGRDQDGLFCTPRAKNILLVALQEAGYSEEEAEKMVDKLMWNKTPEYPTASEMLDAGFVGADYYFMGGKNKNEFRHLNFDFGKSSKNDENNQKKQEGLNNLLSNFENLSQATYKWNGSTWQKQ